MSKDIKKALEHCVEWDCGNCPNRDELGSGETVCRSVVPEVSIPILFYWFVIYFYFIGSPLSKGVFKWQTTRRNKRERNFIE